MPLIRSCIKNTKLYKERQQTAQGQELEQARAAVRSGDLDAVQKHLDIARNLAYAPNAISALERHC